jgi:SPP1 family predicted phage head-tail adaptor
MAITNFFIHRATIQRATKVEDDFGGVTETWNNISTDVPGRMVPITAHESLIAAQLTTEITHRWYCNPDVTVQDQDRIVFNSRNFRVQSVVNPDEADRFLRVTLLEESQT